MTQIPFPVERFGLASRPLRKDDAPAVLELMHAYENKFIGRPLVDLADLTGCAS